MSRRLAWLTPLLICLGLVAAGCQAAPSSRATGAGAAAPAAAPADPAGDQRGGAGDASWQALVQAAEREGKVSVVGAPGGPWREFLATAFTKAYPNIRMNFTGLGSSEVGASGAFSRGSARRDTALCRSRPRCGAALRAIRRRLPRR